MNERNNMIDEIQWQRNRLDRALRDIVETLEDNPTGGISAWMICELAINGRKVLDEVAASSTDTGSPE